MPFQIATLTWALKETQVSHNTFSTCKSLPWTVHTVFCAATHDGQFPNGHELTKAAWKLNDLNTLPDQSALPNSMTGKLKVVPTAISATDAVVLAQHFTDCRQVTLTVRMGSLSGTLTVNLKPL